MNRPHADTTSRSNSHTRHLFVVIAAFLLMLATSGTEAYICAPVNVDEHIDRTPVIFTGRVVAEEVYDPFSEAEDERRPGNARTTFQVAIPWKGVNGATVTIHAGPATIMFEQGFSYTVFAYSIEGGALATDACHTSPLVDKAALYATLRKLKPAFLESNVRSSPQQPAMLKAEAAFRASYADSETALKLYTSVLEANPLDAEGLFGRAQLLMSSKHYEAALDDIAALLALDPSHRVVRRWQDIALFMLGRFSELDADRADLSRFYYEQVDASNARLTRVNLSLSQLWDVKLDGADLTGADLHSARLFKVSLTNAKLAGLNLRGSMMHEVDLRGADLRNADLRHMEMGSVRLDGAQLAGAQYNDQTRWPEGFNPESAGAVLSASE